jgi:hypothetical protein
MSGLLAAPGITPDSGQGQLLSGMSALFGGAAPTFQTPTPAPPAAPPMNTYDKWGHVVSGQAAPPPAAAPQQAASAVTPGASGYDMWGRQAPPPQLPGLADLLAAVQAAQAQQAPTPTAAGLLGVAGSGSDGGNT